VDQVVVRYTEARQIAEGLARDAVHELARAVDAARGATLVVNPTARTRAGLVEARVPGDGPCVFLAPDGTPRPTQLVATTGGEGRPIVVSGQKVRWVLDRMRGTEFQGRQITRYDVVDAGDHHDVMLVEASAGDERCDLGELKSEMLALGEAGRDIRMVFVAA